MSDRDTSSTSYHDLDRPKIGDDWASSWDDLVGDVDANLKLSGSVDDRPDADDTPTDAWFEATDQGLIYRNDADAGWIAIAGMGTADNPLPEQHTESFSTEEQTIGDADTVTGGPLGDSGEWIPLLTSRSNKGTITTTSTSYDRVTTEAESHILPDVSGITNISEIGFSVVSLLKNDTEGETTKLRLVGVMFDFDTNPEVEYTAESDGDYKTVESDIEPLSADGPYKIDDEVCVTEGEGTLEPIGAVLWGKLK